MLTGPQLQYVRSVVRTLQIIVGAMAGGVLMFLAVVLFLVSKNAQPAPASLPVLTYIAVGMSVVIGIAWLIVPGVIVGRMRQSLLNGNSSDWGLVKNMPNAAELGDVVPLAAIYQTRTVIRAALLEGTAFLACIAYMLEHQAIALAIAGLLLLMILSQIPTVSGLESWLDDELATVQQMRQLR